MMFIFPRFSNFSLSKAILFPACFYVLQNAGNTKTILFAVSSASLNPKQYGVSPFRDIPIPTISIRSPTPTSNGLDQRITVINGSGVDRLNVCEAMRGLERCIER